jgi:hypothetical protein
MYTSVCVSEGRRAPVNLLPCPIHDRAGFNDEEAITNDIPRMGLYCLPIWQWPGRAQWGFDRVSGFAKVSQSANLDRSRLGTCPTNPQLHLGPPWQATRAATLESRVADHKPGQFLSGIRPASQPFNVPSLVSNRTQPATLPISRGPTTMHHLLVIQCASSPALEMWDDEGMREKSWEKLR